MVDSPQQLVDNPKCDESTATFTTKVTSELLITRLQKCHEPVIDTKRVCVVPPTEFSKARPLPELRVKLEYFSDRRRSAAWEHR